MEKNKGEEKDAKQNSIAVEVPKRGFLGNLLYGFGMSVTRLLTRLSFEGQENLPAAPYVLAANHVTLVDGMWICAGLPRNDRRHFSAIAGSDLKTDYGIFGQIMMRVGRAIPIDRYGNPVRGLIMAKKAVDQGHILLIHPEGTRSSDGKIAELQNGATYISSKAQVPLVPVFVHGGFEIFSRHMPVPSPIDWKKMRRKKLTIEYGQPLYPSEYANVKEMTEAIASWYLDRQNKNLEK